MHERVLEMRAQEERDRKTMNDPSVFVPVVGIPPTQAVEERLAELTREAADIRALLRLAKRRDTREAEATEPKEVAAEE
jgi:hypothetical protein